MQIAFLALAFTFIFQSSLPPNRSKQQEPASKEHRSATAPPITPSVPIVNDHNPPGKEEAKTKAETQQGQEQFPWGDAATWALVLVGGVAAYLALCTLRDIQQQTKNARRSAIAARDSAKAALLSAQALINAERAWIDGAFKKVKESDAGWEDITNFPHQMRVVNRGRTPAYIVAVELEWGALKLELTELPENLGMRSIEQINIFLPPSRTSKALMVFDMARSVSNSDWLQILAGKKTGVVKTVIKYWDIISRENRDTSFVYSYSTTTASFKRLNWLNVYK